MRTFFSALLIAICAWFCLAQSPCYAQSPLAVILSERNAQAYGEQHLGNWEEAWLAFKQTLEAANVRYDMLTDQDLSGGISKLQGYKLVVVPLLLDLAPEAVYAINEYAKNGGKVLITDGGGNLSQGALALAELAGASVHKHVSTPDGRTLVWQRDPVAISQDFAIGTLLADVQMQGAGNAVARWTDSSGQQLGVAIAKGPSAIYFSWAPGLQGEITTNAYLMTLAFEDLVAGITQQAAIQISFADYQTIGQELAYLTKRTDEAIKTAKQADLAVPFRTIQQSFESAQSHVKAFEDAYKERHFYSADEELQKARHDFALAFAQSMPVRPVEARSIWLDRGTIVACKNEKGLSTLFDKLKAAGINVVYFETNNAGFCMFPTKVGTQNPDVTNWDPLGTAVTEAHKRGMELHSWCWVFAVGNLRHNPIIGKDPDYPGPVLTKYGFSMALARANGALLPNNQPEFWIDPANPEGRQYIKNLMTEIVSNYNVDGLQLDYIRYPFNNKGTEMGYDWVGRRRFEQETGLTLDNLDETTRQLWQAWKIQQVSSFVEDISKTLKSMKPGFRISAAVYAMPHRLRLNAIQQEWETWVQNGWVDTLNPMTYVQTAKDLTIVAGYVREECQDKALVYPGLSIRQLDTAGLIEQLDTSRVIGTLGTTMFAMAQLDDKKQNVLRVGPYRKQPLLTPQSEPIGASRILVDDFAAMVNRYLQDPKKRILSDQSSTNEIMSEIESVQQAVHDLPDKASADEITRVDKAIRTLHANTQDWLRLEAFIQRGFRAQYIASYLAQVEAILSYAAHRAKTSPLLAGGH